MYCSTNSGLQRAAELAVGGVEAVRRLEAVEPLERGRRGGVAGGERRVELADAVPLLGDTEETGVGGEVQASAAAPAFAASTAPRDRDPSTARRASGVKPLTAGTPPSSRGRKAHNCSPSGGTGGVSPGRAEGMRRTRAAR